MCVTDERDLDIEKYIAEYSGCPRPFNRESFSHLNHYVHFISITNKFDGKLDKKLLKNKKVLDIGSGEGFGSYFFNLIGADVIGVDVAPEVSQYSKDKYANSTLNFECADATNLPFGDATFDYIVGMDLLEHVSNVEKLCYELKRVLKPGGYLYMLTPNFLVSLVRRGKIYPFHITEYTSDQFKVLISKEFSKSLFFTESIDHLDKTAAKLRSNSHLNFSFWRIVKYKGKQLIKKAIPKVIHERRRGKKLKMIYNDIRYYKFSLEDVNSLSFDLDKYVNGLDQRGLNFLFLHRK
jgi:SAM-dependent methyltransferase